MINTNAEVSKLTWLQISEDFNTKMERKIEELKAEMKLLTSEQIKNCDICSGHDDLPEHGPLFQKACEGLILARVIEKARKTLEGSLEGDYLSKFNDINLVDELKMKYLGMDDTSDWGLLEALSTKAIYTEPMTSDILNLSSSSKIIKKVVASKLVSSDVSDVEPEVEMKGMVETKDATGGGDADHEKSYYNFAKIQEQIDWGRKYVKSFAKLGTYGGLAPQPPYCNRNCHESRYCLVVIDKFRERTP